MVRLSMPSNIVNFRVILFGVIAGDSLIENSSYSDTVFHENVIFLQV